MNLIESLQNHAAVCEQIYRLMLDLNRVLKEGAAAPEPALLDRQRSALATLERSLAQLRSVGGRSTPPSAEARAALEKCQRTILKALLLDRENEQLLHKNALPRARASAPLKPSPALLAKLYGKAPR